jgi:amino acid transporter
VLASFTSWNGALLTLSRLTYALAAQGLLPRPLARMDRRRLVPANALGALLVLAAALTVAVHGQAAVALVLASAAAVAALVWAAALVVRQRPPFAERTRTPARRLAGFALAAVLVGFGGGALVDALVTPAAVMSAVVTPALAPAPAASPNHQGDIARAH